MTVVSQRDISQVALEKIRWPFENAENFLSCVVPLITFVASRSLANISIYSSFLLAGGVLSGMTFYRMQKNQLKLEEMHKDFQLLLSFLGLDFEEMSKIFKGGYLDERKEFVARDDLLRKKESFKKACRSLQLNPEAAENVWKTFPKNDALDRKRRANMLQTLFPPEIEKMIESFISHIENT